MQQNWLNYNIVPWVCFIGVLIELISLSTFYKINSHGQYKRKPIKIYKYLFLYSISNTIILFINIIFGIFNCRPYCRLFIDDYFSTYFIKQFERFAKIFICNSLNTFSILLEFKIAQDR